MIASGAIAPIAAGSRPKGVAPMSALTQPFETDLAAVLPGLVVILVVVLTLLGVDAHVAFA
jgi:hypothetical protein